MCGEQKLGQLRRLFEVALESLRDRVIDVYGDRLITLAVYGSVGRGTPGPFSDIDILIIATDLPNGRLSRVREFDQVEMAMQEVFKKMADAGIHTSLSPVIKSAKEAERGSLLFLDMVYDARLLFDRNGFFRNLLNRLKQRLTELGSYRVDQGQRWHWVLKPDYVPGEVFTIDK